MIFAAAGSATVLIELGLVLLALAVLGRVAERLGISPVPLYLFVGLALGDSGPFRLDVSSEFIETGATVGVVLLLFLLGLEYSPAELVPTLRANAPAGAVDLAANLLPGAALGLVLGWTLVEALLLGGVTYISSSGIVAKLLADLGRTGNRETPAILSILVIEDLVMAVYLPLVAGLLAGGALLATGVSVAVAVAIVAVIMVVAVRLGPTLSRWLFTRSAEVLLLSVLGAALLVAGLAEEAQVSAAVGAFLVGIAVSGPTEEQARPLLLPLRDLFAAAFFVFFGLEVDVARLPDVVVPALVLAAVTAGTKVATGWWAARRIGVGSRGRRRAGVTLIARGEFSIIIAELGRAAGVVDDLPVLAAAYVLILAVVGPLATRFTEPVRAER
ncbi:MAG: cation:proton antiporter [Acidimicrobiales bacterium]|nr:cation:proton antiporter [Acidimicrobiales bacterium]MCB9372231.1 cation:proton antiporter [Microthrixaceae bacterium]